ncbi:enolase-phosphatase E1 [Ectothiorhodospira magna]|uniref:Enolase-phosphatase E1 n=1 Tax=Ectothiorhodospira magna TaxID=867345 RepID=A0A1H9FZJ1_9GAMM|nr:acireductone synthase [Ectothiorhodospira magna]SEQ43342.1 enolase-phosphatase E1 [Ectothiorhodospira magna]
MIRAIITDIEGTLSGVAFTQQVLLPHAVQHLPDFVRTHSQVPEIKRLLADIRAYAGGGLDDTALIQRMVAWMAADQKITPLKALQGLIWEEGYRRGDFQGHIYPDAVACLRQWHAQGISLHIFSSGSVRAQESFLAHSEAGDLRPLFSDNFDTRIGGKTHVAAYKLLAERIGHAPDDILFLCDDGRELDAAANAGLHTTLVQRHGEVDDTGPHPVVTDFYQIRLMP